jgi:hypothetical protein
MVMPQRKEIHVFKVPPGLFGSAAINLAIPLPLESPSATNIAKNDSRNATFLYA